MPPALLDAYPTHARVASTALALEPGGPERNGQPLHHGRRPRKLAGAQPYAWSPPPPAILYTSIHTADHTTCRPPPFLIFIHLLTPAPPDLSCAANVSANVTHFVFVAVSSVRAVSPHGGRLTDEVDVRGVDEVFLARGFAPVHRYTRLSLSENGGLEPQRQAERDGEECCRR